MTTDNSLNPAKGKMFQNKVAEILSKHFGVKFRLDYPISIGNPPKDHRFDLVSEDKHYVGECKNYSWTEGGNIPSAKMAFVNEAILYLSLLPPETQRFVVMRNDIHPIKRESIADYYYRTNHHLLVNVLIMEIDMETGVLREIGGKKG